LLTDVRSILVNDINDAANIENTEEKLLENEKEEMISVEETADLFNVPPQAVYKWIKKDKIKWKQDSSDGSYLIPKSQFNLVEDDHIKKSQEILLGQGSEIDLIDPSDVYEK